MNDKDGWEKNLDEVAEGIDNMLDEWREAVLKCKDAIAKKDWADLLHHATDFRGAAQEHAWKLWFYTFWPKWIGLYFLAKWWFVGFGGDA